MLTYYQFSCARPATRRRAAARKR